MFPRRDSTQISRLNSVSPLGKSPEQLLLPRRYRTGWISDTHLGTRGCNATALLDFLRENDFETLYVVGDLIDIWSLRRGIYWPQDQTTSSKKFAQGRKGTRVIYIPGNHDELVTSFFGAYGNIDIKENAIHVTACGERILIIHGHELDAVVQNVKWLAFAGDVGYQFLLSLIRSSISSDDGSDSGTGHLAHYAKRRVKDAVSFIGKFEAAVAHYAERYQVDAVLCGHIHSPPFGSSARSHTTTAVTGWRAARHLWKATTAPSRWSLTIHFL